VRLGGNPWPPVARLAARALACVAVIGAVVGGPARPARAVSPSPSERLRAAAHGTLRGRFGTLQFQRDGAVRFVVLECGYLPTTAGYVRSFTDCPPDTTTGRLDVGATGYDVTRPDGTTVHFAAYVDPTGGLHLGFGAVGQLAADRTGTIVVAPTEQLVVGRTGCVDVQTGQGRVVPCRFLRNRGRTVLVYPTTDIATPSGTRQAALVLVGARLLVSPELVDRVYARR
jgi:hypothetical protein